ncbi:MAG TPA: serine hydrolase domain-containing protein [Acidimicrobiia bacterium]|nr:serine hydrolase domain-containing protein [Acidimicrobiia bacterium]
MMAIVNPDGSASYASLGGDPAAGLGLEDHVRIGSVTKVFTAALVLSLVDQGRILLEDFASDYVSRLSIPEGVTVRHLLRHRSGLPDYTDQAILGSREDGLSKAWTAEELYEIVADRPLQFDPGESSTTPTPTIWSSGYSSKKSLERHMQMLFVTRFWNLYR